MLIPPSRSLSDIGGRRASPSASTLLSASLLLLAGCGQGEEAAGAGAQAAPPPREVSIVTVTPTPVAIEDVLPGRVAPRRAAEVRPQVGGIVRARFNDTLTRALAEACLAELGQVGPKADLDFTGTICPPPDSGVPALSEDEKLTFARWIDLGVPVSAPRPAFKGRGWFQDDLRPTLTVAVPARDAATTPLTEIRLGAFVGGIGWTVLQLIGSWYTQRLVDNADKTYGTFAVVIGLLSWIYLQSQVFVYAAEVASVSSRRLWPRALVAERPTEADRVVERALVERSKPAS